MNQPDMLNQSEIKYIVSLSQRHYEQIGFIPEPKIRAYNEKGQVYLARENGDFCGFLLFGKNWPNIKIYQAVIQYDARRRYHGYNLVGKLIKYADKHGFATISLWCANDLDANEFWQECGFQFIQTRDGGNKRGRKHNRWAFKLPNPIQMCLPGLNQWDQCQAKADLLVLGRPGQIDA
jgi:N-acetylglutamate synthase-like GNAT family acetyltransferase